MYFLLVQRWRLEIINLLAFVVLFHVVDQLENFANCFGLII